MKALHRAVEQIPAPVARAIRQISARPRYWRQRIRCRQGYSVHGQRYKQSVLFVAGLPKSGSTWLQLMLASWPGFGSLLIPEAVDFESRTGGSHDYDLPEDVFERFNKMLVVTKMHVPGSPHNVALLRRYAVRYIVLRRDLRDVAVSYYFYVRQTPWHPHYPHYRQLTPAEGLSRFANELLPSYVDWIDSWAMNGDPDLGLTVHYETLVAEPHVTLSGIAQHFGLDNDLRTIASVVKRHDLTRLRQRASATRGSAFYRKGVAGDWVNYFTPALHDEFAAIISDRPPKTELATDWYLAG